MRLRLVQETRTTTEEPGLVSARFLSDFFRSLERHNVPVTQMLGDLPITVDEVGKVARSVEWAAFTDFMKRLEHHLGGPEGLEDCGERITKFKPARALQSLAGISASPYALYRAASLWALRRAMPGVETRIEEIQPNRLEIKMRLKDGLRPCPQLFHLNVGGARALPSLLGMADAVVTAEVGDFEAQYQITMPPSRTLWARLTRVSRAVFSASSVLQFLEAQQLELHAKHDALQKTHAALAESERRYRAIADTAVDVLCELDEHGRIIYVSASVEELMGYSPEQVTGSHFSLWVPGRFRDRAKQRFEAFASEPVERAIIRERLKLHTETGDQIVAEFSLRAYRTPEGELRMVVILRDETDRPARRRKEKTRRERNDLDALRATVESRRQSNPEHPIGKSLAALLSALETGPSDLENQAMDSLVAATDRMTQIVESAIVHAPDRELNFHWLETKSLIDIVQGEFRAKHASAGHELRIDVSSAPPIIWGEEVLLAAGLGSLLDWAAERTHDTTQITLSVETARDHANGGASVVFSVSRATSLRAATDSAVPEDGSKPDPRSILALATAEDVASALGGDLVLPDESTHWAISRIQLHQPRRRG